MNYYTLPSYTDSLALFEYSVRKVISLGLMNVSRSHQTWANILFNQETNPSIRSELMSKVKHSYSAYFDENLHYMFLEDKIKTNFPYLFGIKEDLDIFERMQRALDAEVAEQKSPRNREMYHVASCTKMSVQDNVNIYKATLIIDEGADPHFVEGVPFEFKSVQTSYQCETIEFDYVNANLYFSSSRELYVGHDARVILDATFNIIALKKRIEDIANIYINKEFPLYKFLMGQTQRLKTITHNPYPEYLAEKLDDSQFRAFKAALDKDITFIWGPPGTGKSYTLAAIIMALYQMGNERTAICCLSNVAVDQLANKVVDIIEIQLPDMNPGEFYRAGRTQDINLISKDFLFPNDDKSRSLITKIKVYNKKVERYRKERKQYSDNAIKDKAKLKDLREELKDHTDYLISQVKVVFSTISNFVINARLKDATFDNLIVDEASMLAEPQLFALAKNVTKRIILVGDFQQLSPITTAGIPILKNSVFKLCGIDIENTNHPALHQLLNQRRSNPKLVDIINNTFYANRLNAKNNINHPIVVRAPYSGNVIAMKCVNDGVVRFTKGGTRQNVANAEAVLDLLDLYASDIEDTFSIGIITPYTGQVSLLKALFIGKNYDIDFQDRVRIGTVHTFQGSECDVIIFDMVDSHEFEKGSKVYFGKIYQEENGEELLNVAISRAKHKLIVVCDPGFIDNPPGNVISRKSSDIFKKLLKYKNTKE